MSEQRQKNVRPILRLKQAMMAPRGFGEHAIAQEIEGNTKEEIWIKCWLCHLLVWPYRVEPWLVTLYQESKKSSEM